MSKYTPQIPDYDRVQKLGDYWDFVAWMATPSMKREYKTQREFARVHSIHENQLGKWKQMPEFGRDLMKLVQKNLTEYTGDVGYALLAKIFKDGSAAEIRLWREWAHEIMPAMRVEHTVTEDGSKTVEEVKKVLEDFENKLKETLSK